MVIRSGQKERANDKLDCLPLPGDGTGVKYMPASSYIQLRIEQSILWRRLGRKMNSQSSSTPSSEPGHSIAGVSSSRLCFLLREPISASVPRKKAHLSRKNQALVSLAVDSAATHLYVPGIRTHIAAAPRRRRCVHEVIEVIELSSTLGIHACNIGVPLLVEVLREDGGYESEINKAFDESQEAESRFHTQERILAQVLGRFPEARSRVFRSLPRAPSSVPWTKEVGGDGEGRRGALEPKVIRQLLISRTLKGLSSRSWPRTSE